MMIRHKLLVAFCGVGLLTGAASFIALTINSSIKEDISQISHGSIEKPRAAADMAESLMSLRLRAQELLTERQITNGATTRARETLDQEAVEAVTKAAAGFEAGVAACRKITKIGIQLATVEGSSEEIKAATEEMALLDDIEAKFVSFKDHLGSALSPANANQEGMSLARLPGMDAYQQIVSLVDNFQTGAERQLSNEVVEVEDSLVRANATILWSTLAILLVGFFLAWLIARAFSRRVGLITNAAQRIGEGRLDTTIDFRSQDELGLLARTFNQMARDLQATTVSRDYVGSIIKSMAHTLIVVEADGIIKSVNEATLHLLGYTENELVGQPMGCVLDGRTGSALGILDEVKQKGFLSGAEVAYRTSNGAEVPMTFSASVIRDASNSVIGLVCVAEDISRRKKIEAELEQTHNELIKASRFAGMAEVATGVLHNVGNVLNSVNVSASLVDDDLKKSKMANLARVVALIREHSADLGTYLTVDPKGKQLPGYLAQLSDHLAGEQEAIVKEMHELRSNIEHIKEIVAMQQSYAKLSGVTELLNVTDLVEDTLRMNAGALVRHEVKVIREFDSQLPEISTDRHRVLQILVNLVRNAKYACFESGRTDKQLIVRVTNGDDRVRIAVTDNGVGIAPENLTRIFAHGFTTKKDGHGFGLHSGALAAKELGGSLGVHSDGLGCGATFTLELPLQSPKVAHG
jgi:PAS domain S-box-containing protein